MTLEENCSESCVQNCSGRWENFEDKCYKRSEDEKIASLGSGRIGIPPCSRSNQTTTEETKTALSSAGGVRIARGKESILSSGTMRLVRKVQNLSVQRRFVTTPPRPHHLQRTLVPISQVHSLCAINLPCRTPHCTVTITLATSATLGLIIFASLVFLGLRCKRRKKSDNKEPSGKEMNPLYGH